MADGIFVLGHNPAGSAALVAIDFAHPVGDGSAIANCGVAVHLATWGAARAFAVSIAINCSIRGQTYRRS
jgi:hypothetical protein